ncbi:Uncharacterized protein HZ326_11580 [Fusarium oxysporum f. sp. albedinis]|nr:Uncharacterized protein HZ326_11580 [Fusarium oxysporum f. sp. albedinis]
MEVFNADGADHSEQRTLVFGIGVVGHTLIFNITAHPLLRYDGVGLSQNEVHGKAEENGLDSLISKLMRSGSDYMVFAVGKKPSRYWQGPILSITFGRSLRLCGSEPS